MTSPKSQRAQYANRTRAKVDSTITQRHGLDSLGNKYLDCRYAPFGAGMKSFIPDSRGKNIIVRDWTYTYDLVTLAEGCEVRISPFFPYPVKIWSPTGNVTVDGTAIGNYSVAPTVPDTYGMILNSVLANNLTAAGTAQTRDTQATKAARVATVGYRLFYTGQASAAQGLIQTDMVPWNQGNNDFINSNAINLMVRAGTANTSYGINTVGFFELDSMPFNQQQKTRDTDIKRPEDGLKGVLKAASLTMDHAFQPFWETGKVPINPTGTETSPYAIWSIGSTPNAPGMGGLPGLMFVDPHFQETNIKIISAGSFRLEVFFCAEFELDLSHSMIDMAANSPLIDRPLLELSEKLNHEYKPVGLADPITLGMGLLSMGRPNRPPRAKRAMAAPPPKPRARPQPRRRRRNKNRARGPASPCNSKPR